MTAHWTLDQLQTSLHGHVLLTHGTEFFGVGTDSRKNLAGQLFVALKGDSFDGHDFLLQAVTQGATGLIVHQVSEITNHLAQKVTVIVVRDTLQALQTMARDYRRRCQFKVVGITGSNGKTTTKEFTRDLLKDSFTVHASVGSFNNHWGVPLTLLSAPPTAQVVIQEMGMNHAGELTRLSEIAEPDVVVVTMVGSAHIGELGSSRALAEAKKEIYIASPQAQAIFNLDNAATIEMFAELESIPRPRILTFSSFREDVDVNLRAHRIGLENIDVAGWIGTVKGRTQVPVLGRQNVTNLMAAASIGLSLGVDAKIMWQRLPQLKTIWGRGFLLHHACGARIIFDGYNSNPESAAALLRNLMEIETSGRQVAILGEMLELGFYSAQAHYELGEIAGAGSFDEIWFVGPHGADFENGLQAARYKGFYYQTEEVDPQIATALQQKLFNDDIVIIKGSRGVHLEQVLKLWGVETKT